MAIAWCKSQANKDQRSKVKIRNREAPFNCKQTTVETSWNPTTMPSSLARFPCSKFICQSRLGRPSKHKDLTRKNGKRIEEDEIGFIQSIS